MDNHTKLGKGLLVIDGLHLRRQKPAFRNDIDYEESVLRILSEYMEYAIDNGLSVLFLEDCIRNITVKQALFLMQIKHKTTMFIHHQHQSHVNPALIDMHCIEVLDKDVYQIGGKVLTFDESTKNADKYILKRNGGWLVESFNDKGIKREYTVPKAIFTNAEHYPGALLITGNVSCKEFHSTSDDISNLAPVSEICLNDEKHFEFTERLRDIAMKRNASINTSQDGIECFINSLEMGEAKERITLLYKQVSTDANYENH
ncbi:hypothetical protein BM526_20140 (plasmid) [Alteromonas mediterranea]|uniref:hypothetical protein n=1 Tax=Alteromonas mediterranea TaxID=314275 RepID=UPI0009039250|nr:hypothetical protein [Alteromonas mediterranea]APE04284.1 hypothetical protein BM526_20140 [Alteromonas mediterranea]